MKELSTKAKLFILIIIAAGIGLSIWQLSGLDGPPLSVAVLALLAIASQILKVEGATKRSSYNISWLIYGFTFVLLGTPATLVVILVAHLVEWLWHRVSLVHPAV